MTESESPVPEVSHDRVTDIGWLNGGNTTDWSNGVPGQWTPGSSSGDSTGSRPLLGRRDSTDDLPPHPADRKLHSNCTQGVFKKLDSGSFAAISDLADGTWSQDCGAWTDINSEINGGQTIPWNGNHQTVGNNSGLYTSTGFFANPETSQDARHVNGGENRTLNEDVNVATSYPRYSNGFNVYYPDAISHVALLLNKLMQHGSSNVAEKNGFRNYNSLEEGKFCAFCKKNRERREFYTTHIVKDSWGKVICPILRKYTCPNCGATGDNAHTLRHCPIRANQDMSL